MPAPQIIFDEVACMDALKAFLVTCCAPELKSENIYRSHPSASPSNFGVSCVIVPINGGPPINTSYMGEESFSKQIQVVNVVITKAAVGTWKVNLLGQTAQYVAGGGDTATTIRDGMRAAVIALDLPIITSNITFEKSPGFKITANVAGVSMLVNQLTAGDIPAGGASQIIVVDDNIRRASYNWGIWTVRLIFRDPPPSNGGPLPRILASSLAERARCWFQANASLPVTNGLAYPYQGDLFNLPPARLSWRQTQGPFSVPEEENGVWMRAVAIDVSFDVPTGLLVDIPSIDTMGPGTLILT